MRVNLLKHSAIACVFAFGIATTAFAQTTATDEAKSAGQETKEAAKAAGEAGEHAGKAVAKGAKKTGQVTEDAAKETATGTKKAAKKVGKAVTPDTTSATCKDGTVETGKTKTTACIDHGGVKEFK
jgi:hypothetical protein